MSKKKRGIGRRLFNKKGGKNLRNKKRRLLLRKMEKKDPNKICGSFCIDKKL